MARHWTQREKKLQTLPCSECITSSEWMPCLKPDHVHSHILMMTSYHAPPPSHPRVRTWLQVAALLTLNKTLATLQCIPPAPGSSRSSRLPSSQRNTSNWCDVDKDSCQTASQTGPARRFPLLSLRPATNYIQHTTQTQARTAKDLRRIAKSKIWKQFKSALVLSSTLRIGYALQKYIDKHRGSVHTHTYLETYIRHWWVGEYDTKASLATVYRNVYNLYVQCMYRIYYLHFLAVSCSGWVGHRSDSHYMSLSKCILYLWT